MACSALWWISTDYFSCLLVSIQCEYSFIPPLRRSLTYCISSKPCMALRIPGFSFPCSSQYSSTGRGHSHKLPCQVICNKLASRPRAGMHAVLWGFTVLALHLSVVVPKPFTYFIPIPCSPWTWTRCTIHWLGQTRSCGKQ